MRPSLRFLAVAVLGWAGVRAATLGAIPAGVFRIEPSQAKPPPITPTQFPAIDPIDESATLAAAPAEAAYPLPAQASAPRAQAIPFYYPAPAPAQAYRSPAASGLLPEPRRQFFDPISTLSDYPLSRIAAASWPPLESSVTVPGQSLPIANPHRLDRLQLSTWALLRSQRSGVAGTPSLASGGSLGASQAGARLVYNVTPQLAAYLRTSSEVGRRGGEAAAGVRAQPLKDIPLWLDAERRQRIGRFGGGRSAFALFLEGGVYDRLMPLDFLLNAYLQAGVVSVHQRDKFIDGGLTLTRPVYRNFFAGFGVWGGAQPGVYRVDVGPRVTMRVRSNVYAQFDWRQRVAGHALPGSGPAVTLSGAF